jgi:hypothetical protein
VISLMLILMLVIGGLLLVAALGWGVFLLLVQLGVIVKEAGKPQHADTYDYTLKQGREVGGNDNQ